MSTLNVAEAKARFSELVDRATNGETVAITKRGKPVATLAPVTTPRKPLEVERLKKVFATHTPQVEPAVLLVRRMRDDGY